MLLGDREARPDRLARGRRRGPWRRGLRRCARTRRRDRRCRRWRSRSSRRRAHSRRRSASRVIAILATSEPDFGSVSAKAAIASPARVRLSQCALLGVAEQADRAGAEPLHGEGEIGKPVVARERLAHEAERAHVERGGRVGIGRGVREPAVAAEAFARDRGRRRRRRRDRPAGWPRTSARCVGQRAMAVGEERPGEEGLSGISLVMRGLDPRIHADGPFQT